jgi:hypothetical protein
MRENVTVQQALKKGKLKLVYIPLLLLLSSIGIGVYLQSVELFSGWAIGISIIVGFLLSWLAWSYFVVEWKVWAFENVRNVHELKRKAIEQKLIWTDGSWFNKTEIINYEQKQKLKQLEKKFLEKDIYHDDISVPKETAIYFSKTTMIIEFVVGIFMLASGIYLYTIDSSGYFWMLLPLIGVYSFYSCLKKYLDKSPQISINREGIKLKNTNLIPWNQIYNDRVFNESHGKHSTNYFVFNNEKISIDNLDIKFDTLESLLQIYRVRFEKNNPNES